MEESIDKKVIEESIKKKVIGESIKKSRKYKEIEESNSDFESIMVVLLFSVLLCIHLLPIPNLSDSAGTLGDLLPPGFCTCLLIGLVLVYQIAILLITLKHPVNRSIFAIFFILVITTPITVIEASFYSKATAIIVLIFWSIILALIAIVKGQEFYNICTCLRRDRLT
ncbi:hypothetical protein RYX36_024642 [Vicia faba]